LQRHFAQGLASASRAPSSPKNGSFPASSAATCAGTSAGSAHTPTDDLERRPEAFNPVLEEVDFTPPALAA